jgi:hypothetical protein
VNTDDAKALGLEHYGTGINVAGPMSRGVLPCPMRRSRTFYCRSSPGEKYGLGGWSNQRKNDALMFREAETKELSRMMPVSRGD